MAMFMGTPIDADFAAQAEEMSFEAAWVSWGGEWIKWLFCGMLDGVRRGVVLVRGEMR